MHPELVEMCCKIHTTRASLLRATKLYFLRAFYAEGWGEGGGGGGLRPGLGIMRHEYIAH
jgi:hypothetical protein